VPGPLNNPIGPFVDSWQELSRPENQQSYTQHGFAGVPTKGRIDWILTTSEFRILDVSIVYDQEAGRYPSDHFPLWADLELPDEVKSENE
jgi:endonuclease/exonuclease/phosphatase family metal-dependent hydrolase